MKTLRFCALVLVLFSSFSGHSQAVNVNLGQEAVDEVFFEKEIEGRLARDIEAYLGHNRFIIGVDFNLSADGTPGGEEGVIIREVTTPLPGLPKASETFSKELTGEELNNLKENLFLDDQVGTRSSVIDGQGSSNGLSGSGTEVYLVLDTTVNSVQESFVRELIARKLALDVAGGDSVQVVRSTFGEGSAATTTAPLQQQPQSQPQYPQQFQYPQSPQFIPGFPGQPQQASVVNDADSESSEKAEPLDPEALAKEIAEATTAAVTAAGMGNGSKEGSFFEENFLLVLVAIVIFFLFFLLIMFLLLRRSPGYQATPYYQPAPAAPANSESASDAADSEAKAVRNSVAEIRREIASVGLASPESSKVEMESLLVQGRMDVVAPVYKVLGEDVFESLFGQLSSGHKSEIGEYLTDREMSDTQLEAQSKEFYSRMVRSASESAQSNRSQAFKFLEKLHVSQLLFLMKGEKTRIQALIVSQLPSKMASSILQNLETGRRSEVIHELAQFEAFPVETFKDVATLLAKKARKLPAVENIDTDGIGILMNLLDSMNTVEEGRVLSDLETKDPELHQKLRSQYFTFNDLARAPQKVMGEAMLDVDKGSVAAALTGANESVIRRVLGSLPKRLADSVKEEMNLLKGKVEDEQVQGSRKVIVSRMRDLVREGKIDMEKI